MDSLMETFVYVSTGGNENLKEEPIFERKPFSFRLDRVESYYETFREDGQEGTSLVMMSGDSTIILMRYEDFHKHYKSWMSRR